MKGEIIGEIFKIEGKAEEVHNLTLAELNTAINKINGDNSREPISTRDISISCDLFYLRSLKKFKYSSASPSYWLASPVIDNDVNLRCVNHGGGVKNGTYNTFGVRPVVSLISDIYKDGDIWKIKE